MIRTSRWTIALLLLTSTACTHGLTRHARTTVGSVRAADSGALVVGPMGRPPVVVGLGGQPGAAPQLPALSVETSARRLDRTERELFELIDDAGILGRTMSEADLGPTGVPDAGFYVSVNVTNYQEHFEGPDGRYWAGMIIGGMTAGLGFLLAIDSHANSHHSFDFEVRVYDVRGAPVLRTTDANGTIVNRYDTSISAPLMRRTYSGTMHTWIGSGTTGPTGPDLDSFVQAQAEEVASVIFDAAVEDIARAIRNAPPPTATTREASPTPEPSSELGVSP